MADHKKKRHYATQAYEFGANSALPQGGAPPPMMPGQMGIPQGAPAMGVPSPQDALAGQFGQMNIGAGQAAQPGYPQPGYQQPGYQQPGVQAAQPQAPVAVAPQNQLLPSDLIQQVSVI